MKKELKDKIKKVIQLFMVKDFKKSKNVKIKC